MIWQWKEFIMLRWIANRIVHYVPTPERLAERALNELRLELYQAEQHVLNAQMHAAYYRARLTFLEEVIATGIEKVADKRRGQLEGSQALRAGPKLTEVVPEIRTFG
jgi:hypothetical protein